MRIHMVWVWKSLAKTKSIFYYYIYLSKDLV